MEKYFPAKVAVCIVDKDLPGLRVALISHDMQASAAPLELACDREDPAEKSNLRELENAARRFYSKHSWLYAALFWTALVLVWASIGGVIFHLCEHNHESKLIEDRIELETALEQMSANGTSLANATSLLHSYYGLLSVPNQKSHNRWTVQRAMYFAFTSCATIGYGFTYPRTGAGKLMVYLYCLPGIALYGFAFLTIGRILMRMSASAFRLLLECVANADCVFCLKCCDWRRLKTEDGTETPKEKPGDDTETTEQKQADEHRFALPNIFFDDGSKTKLKENIGSQHISDEPMRFVCGHRDCGCFHSEANGLKCLCTAEMCIAVQRILLVTVTVFLCCLFGALSLQINEGWSFTNSMYFLFVSISTIGYGDLMPSDVVGKGPVVANCFIYFGLCLVLAACQMIQTGAGRGLRTALKDSIRKVYKAQQKISKLKTPRSKQKTTEL